MDRTGQVTPVERLYRVPCLPSGISLEGCQDISLCYAGRTKLHDTNSEQLRVATEVTERVVEDLSRLRAWISVPVCGRILGGCEMVLGGLGQ